MNGTAAPIRVAIVDDHPVFREGTAALLASEPDIQVVGLGGSSEDALALADQGPDVMLLDVRLGEESGLQILQGLARRSAVIVVTAYDYPEYVRAAIDAGAAGFVAKGSPTADLLTSIRRAATGGMAFTSRPGGSRIGLTSREQEIVGLVTEGLSNDEIGQRLGISTKAVEGHLRRIFARTGVHSRTELAVRAVREGWSVLP